MTDKRPDALQPTRDAVRGVLIDNLDVHAGKPGVMGIYDIAKFLLGFDPLRGKNTNTAFGGRTKDAWVNEHLSMSKLRKVLAEMIEAGELVKLTKPGHFSTNTETDNLVVASVFFSYGLKSGYLLASTFATATGATMSADRNRRRGRILAAAEKSIAEKYAAEVNTLYVQGCREAGLDPQRESDTRG